MKEKQQTSQVIRLIHEFFPSLASMPYVEISGGWDSAVYEFGSEWIIRVPRRAEVVDWIRAETRLLPELAPHLTTMVPHFELVCDRDRFFAVGYRKIPGVALNPSSIQGSDAVRIPTQLGVFLSQLHSFSSELASVLLGERCSANRWKSYHDDIIQEFHERVVPLLSVGERARGETFLKEWRDPRMTSFLPVLTHSDLGPSNLLIHNKHFSGVIDWSEARVGDPAIDFGWLLYGTPEEFRGPLVAAYAGDLEEIAHRAHFFYRLMPWHEVRYGLDHGGHEFVARGFAGITAHLS
jgi:aminoglycoside phosphotransferase (APT) family kinase protein